MRFLDREIFYKTHTHRQKTIGYVLQKKLMLILCSPQPYKQMPKISGTSLVTTCIF